MVLLKNRIKSIISRPIESIVLLFVILIPTTLLVSMTLVQIAIDDTIIYLRENLPPLIMLEPEFRLEYNESGIGWIETDGGNFLGLNEIDSQDIMITTEQLYTLSDLLYVDEMHTSTLNFFYNPNIIQQLQHLVAGESLFVRRMWTEQRFVAYGISSPNISYFEKGILEITDGRLPTIRELRGEAGIIPIMIPRVVAEVSFLYVGDSLEMFQIIPSGIPMGINFDGTISYVIDSRSYTEEYAFSRMGYQFEIIGIFDWIDELEFTPFTEDTAHLHRLMFIPVHISEEMALFYHEQQLLYVEEEGLISVDEFEFSNPFNFFIRNIFVLSSSSYLDDFRSVASEFISDLVNVNDLSVYIFGNSEIILEFQRNAATLISLIAFILIVLLLGGGTIRLLRKRTLECYEVAKVRLKMAIQVVREILIIACIGFFSSLFIGYNITRQVAPIFISNLLAKQSTDERYLSENWYIHESTIERLGFELPQMMNNEEVLDAFDITLGPRAIIVFVGIGLGAIVLSTKFPIIYIVKLSPKKILMQRKIE